MSAVSPASDSTGARMLRTGSKIEVDGLACTVLSKRGDMVFVHWFTGEPLVLPNGRTVGWAHEDTHYEWIPIASDRLTTQRAAAPKKK